MKDLNELFWTAHIDELKNGYSFDSAVREYICLVCGKTFAQGVIYKSGEAYCEAWKAAELHVRDAHRSMFHNLLDMDKKYTGLTEHQKSILTYFHDGLTDRDIASKLGDISPATVRNHRFTLREREKEARIFLAIMQLIKDKSDAGEEFVEHPRTATMIDDRYAITQNEMAGIIEKYFTEGPDGPLDEFPKKQKRKLAILLHISKRFKPAKKYSEKEINKILKEIYHDYVTIRRLLVDYGFFERTADGGEYWLKSTKEE